MKFLPKLVVLVFLAGCADGSALITGQVRPEIQDYTSVTIHTEMPEGAEQIAIVNASSDSGFNQQQKLDYAVEELKKQAAKVGANAVVLTDRGTGTNVVGIPNHGPQGGTNVYSSEVAIVKGVAVYVP